MVLTPNSKHNHLCMSSQAPLQDALQLDGWIIFILQDTKSGFHVTIKVMGSNDSN